MPGEPRDKTVRISFQVDQASADKVSRVITKLTEDVEKLSKAASAGFGGGLGGGFKVTNFGGGKGQGSVGARMNQKVGGVAGDVVDGLTKAASASASLFKAAGKGAQESFKGMSDALKEMVNRSSNEVVRLEGSLSKLERSFSRLKAQKAAGMTGPGMDAVIAENQQRLFSTASQLADARTSQKGFESQIKQYGPPTVGDRVKSFFGIPQGGFKPGTNPLSMIGSVAGSPGGAIVAGLKLGYNASQYLAGAGNAYSVGNVGYALDRPMINLQNQATVGQVYGGMAVRARTGGISQTMAFHSLMRDASLQDIFGTEAAERLVAKIKLENPVGFIDSVTKGRGMKSAITQKIGQFYSQTQAVIKGGGVEDRAGSMLGQEITQAQLMQQLPAEYAKRFADAIQAKEASNPYLNMIANNIYSGAFSDISGINASRTSGRVVYDKRTGKPINTDYDLFQARAQKNLFDPGQVSGMMQGLSDILGRRLSGMGIAERMLSANIGGFSSASGVFSAGSQFGRGLAGGNSLFGTFQHAIGGGRGALDIGAGSMVGNIVSGSMLSGNFLGSSGVGLAQTALSATYTGNTGSDMKMARTLGAGIGAMDSFASGSLDPLQGAVNMSAALRVAGGMSWQTKKTLMGLDSASLMDIMRTGKVPPALQGTGVTPDMVRQYVQARNGMEFSRVNSGMLTPETAAAVNRYRNEGIGYLRGLSVKERNTQLNLLANGLRLGTGHTFEADLMELRLEAGAAGGILKSPHGRGAGRSVSRKSLTGRAAIATGANTEGLGKKKAENEGVLGRSIDETPYTAEGYEDTRANVMGSLGDELSKEAATASQALMSMANLMKAMGQMGMQASRGTPVPASSAGKPKSPSYRPHVRSEMASIPGFD